jgi:hypothetical protein
MRKFGRTYEVIIQLEDGTQIEIKPPISCEFKVNRTVLAEANNCQIKLYNLADTTRGQLFRDRFNYDSYMPIQVKAGYETADFVVFKGSIFEAGTVREGTDWVTTIEAKDGFLDMRNSTTSTTVQAGTEKKDMISQLAKNFDNIVIGVVGAMVGDPPERGLALFGNTNELINEISGGRSFVDGEVLNVLADEEYLAQFVLKLDGGDLIGTPMRKESQLEAKALFYPQATVKMLLELENSQPQYNGGYVVLAFSHDFTWSGAQAGTATTSFTLDRGAELLKGVS